MPVWPEAMQTAAVWAVENAINGSKWGVGYEKSGWENTTAL